MPAKSPAQERLMQAAAHTKGGYDGVPQAVGKEFTKPRHAADGAVDDGGGQIDVGQPYWTDSNPNDGQVEIYPDGQNPMVAADHPGVIAHLQNSLGPPRTPAAAVPQTAPAQPSNVPPPTADPSLSDFMSGVAGYQPPPVVAPEQAAADQQQAAHAAMTHTSEFAPPPPVGAEEQAAEDQQQASFLPARRIWTAPDQQQAAHAAMTYPPESAQQTAAASQPPPVVAPEEDEDETEAQPDEWNTAQKQYEDAIQQRAKNTADFEKQKGDAIHQIGVGNPPPAPQMVDPTQYYANIGNAMGAHSPLGSRLLGGIVTGLFSGLGAVGSAMSGQPNGAQQIISQSIQHTIDAANNQNQLTRQQWADQHSFLTEQTNGKIQELAALEGSGDAQANASQMIAQNRLNNIMERYKLGILQPEQAKSLGAIQEADLSMSRLMRPFMAQDLAHQENGSWIASTGTAMARKLGGMIPLAENDSKVFQRNRLDTVNKVAEMLAGREGIALKEAPEDRKNKLLEQSDDMVPKLGESAETHIAKMNEWEELKHATRSVREMAAHGRNPLPNQLQTVKPRRTP